MYNGIVQPRLDYAIAIWGFTSQQNISKVQRLQNRAARIITGNHDSVHRPTRGINIVKQLNWMNVVQRRDYFIALSMFKCIHGLSPVYLSDLITMSNDIAIRPTRASSWSWYGHGTSCDIRYYKAIVLILWSGDMECPTKLY